ncbi:hypothetical protein B5X24_HaOG216240 [Helicoverpa armigera]|nr:hypothetical protein B5X24_HaOG216240 [Helicoverpa armigera]
MYAKQLRGNWSCPFPPGRSIFRNLVTYLDHIPLVPFTYSSLIVRTRVDLNISIGPPGGPVEEIAFIKVYTTVKQHLKNGKH